MTNVRMWMGAYGAECPKPTVLMGTLENAPEIYKPLADDFQGQPVTRKHLNKEGKMVVSGFKSELKASQAYPKEFGVAVAAHYAKHIVPYGEGVHMSDLQKVPTCEDMWEDAGLRGVWQALGSMPP